MTEPTILFSVPSANRLQKPDGVACHVNGSGMLP
jgi:hypothetical protein